MWAVWLVFGVVACRAVFYLDCLMVCCRMLEVVTLYVRMIWLILCCEGCVLSFCLRCVICLGLICGIALDSLDLCGLSRVQ